MKRVLAGLFALALTVSMSNVNAITIVNGSFEDITGMTDNGSYANGIPTGWSYTGTTLQALKSPPFSPSGVDGDYYIEIYSSPDFGTLSQIVTGLTIGQEYELSFLWGNRMLGYDFTIEMGGSSFNESGTDLVNMIAESFAFTATAMSEDLNLTWNDSGLDSVSGGALDAFVLTETGPSIPEPTTLLLMGFGLAGIGYRRRKLVS